jgi:hypothetical protein
VRVIPPALEQAAGRSEIVIVWRSWEFGGEVHGNERMRWGRRMITGEVLGDYKKKKSKSTVLTCSDTSWESHIHVPL